MRKPTPLKLAIVASGVPQKDIATAVGVGESHFSRIVNGLWCDETTKALIASILGRTVGELFPGHGPEGSTAAAIAGDSERHMGKAA